MLSRFDTILERDGRMDGQTDRIPISISPVSIAVLTCDKNSQENVEKILSHVQSDTFTKFITIRYNTIVCSKKADG